MKNDRNMQPIPELGKTYSFFHDGKIKASRHMKVTIENIIPFEQMSIVDVVDLWKQEIEDCDWIYAPQTDYFIAGCVVWADRRVVTQFFVRTVDGEWFSLGYLSGLLDVTGEYSELIRS